MKCEDGNLNKKNFYYFIYNSEVSLKRSNTIFHFTKYNTEPDVIFALIWSKYVQRKNCLKENENGRRNFIPLQKLSFIYQMSITNHQKFENIEINKKF